MGKERHGVIPEISVITEKNLLKISGDVKWGFWEVGWAGGGAGWGGSVGRRDCNPLDLRISSGEVAVGVFGGGEGWI